MDNFLLFVLLALVVGIVLLMAGTIGYSLGADHPSAYGKFVAVCHYRGGVTDGDICYKGSTIIQKYSG